MDDPSQPHISTATSNPSSLSDQPPAMDSSQNSTGNASQPALSLQGRSHSAFATTTTPSMTASSTPLGAINAARRLPPQSTMARGGVNPDIAARMKAFHLERRGAPPSAAAANVPHSAVGVAQNLASPSIAGGLPSNIQLPAGLSRPTPIAMQSAPSVPGAGNAGRGLSLAEKRGLKMPGGLPGAPTATMQTPASAARQKPKMSLANIHGAPTSSTPADTPSSPPKVQSAMDRYAEFIDKETGSLSFKGRAVLTNKGVEFASGQSFAISLDEVDTLDELGKGNYGTVYKVRHARPSSRKPGQGLAGNKAHVRQDSLSASTDIPSSPRIGDGQSPSSGKVMAMKELRLELEDSKFAAIIMELDILHKCTSPFIVDFYGAFFQEGAVYICMEFMDGGSIDKIYGDGIPENVLRKITLATTRGLQSLKDEHNIIHRDVKPTNILMNTLGAVKICDFGVSGNLVASIAKTNIGCQSYMAPERISSGGVAQAGANPGGGTYSVQSDIWSLGLTIIECALGRYPYPPETYDNIFSQLSAIVDGTPPDLPADRFSIEARNFVAGCLNKIPKLRPTYAMLLQHVWLAPLNKVETITEEDEDEDGAAVESSVSTDTGSNVQIVESGGTDGPASKGDGMVDEHGEKWIDRDVGLWVREQLDKKRQGRLGKHRSPALHAAPLDAVPKQPKNAGAVAV